MARTMTDKQERDLRDKASRLHDWPTFGLATQRIFMDLLAELDAERAAHEATTAEANFAHSEVAALKARLALAEAVCASCYEGKYADWFDSGALAAWNKRAKWHNTMDASTASSVPAQLKHAPKQSSLP